MNPINPLNKLDQLHQKSLTALDPRKGHTVKELNSVRNEIFNYIIKKGNTSTNFNVEINDYYRNHYKDQSTFVGFLKHTIEKINPLSEINIFKKNIDSLKENVQNDFEKIEKEINKLEKNSKINKINKNLLNTNAPLKDRAAIVSQFLEIEDVKNHPNLKRNIENFTARMSGVENLSEDQIRYALAGLTTHQEGISKQTASSLLAYREYILESLPSTESSELTTLNKLRADVSGAVQPKDILNEINKGKKNNVPIEDRVNLTDKLLKLDVIKNNKFFRDSLSYFSTSITKKLENFDKKNTQDKELEIGKLQMAVSDQLRFVDTKTEGFSEDITSTLKGYRDYVLDGVNEKRKILFGDSNEKQILADVNKSFRIENSRKPRQDHSVMLLQLEGMNGNLRKIVQNSSSLTEELNALRKSHPRANAPPHIKANYLEKIKQLENKTRSQWGGLETHSKDLSKDALSSLKAYKEYLIEGSLDLQRNYIDKTEEKEFEGKLKDLKELIKIRQSHLPTFDPSKMKRR